jgi:predicted DNA-binding transcriptional regulator AlpA
MGSLDSRWPDLIVARRMPAYTGLSRATINRAVAAGLLPVAGRVGGRGERVFRKADVDRWLVGDTRPEGSR